RTAKGRTDERYYWDRGTKVVPGNRTSLIVDPPDGRIPPLTPAGRASVEAARIREQGTEGPEQRNLNERCITRSLPRLPDLYNNNYLIVQTPGYVVILMDDDPRCPPDSTRRPTAYPTDHSTVARRRARSLEGQHPH